MIKLEECVYTSCYCEENVYKFIEKYSHHFDDVYAVFITNPRKHCVIWCQKLSDEPSVTPVCWDYHVIVIAKKSSQSLVFDLDTVLPFPCLLESYTAQCFQPSASEISQWWLQYAMVTGHYFRPIQGPDFLSTFSSDRSHMIDKRTGSWNSEPPDYEPIFKPDLGNNLLNFLDLDNTDLPGKWLDLKGLHEFFG